jgi:hypothetical protein
VQPNKKGPAKKRKKDRRKTPSAWRRCDDCRTYAETFGNYTTALIAALSMDILPAAFHTNQDGGIHFRFAV